MATRRIAEKSSPRDVATPSGSEKPSDSDVTPAVPTNVIMKLLGFSVAMVVVPIGSYFVMVDFGASATVGGIVAAVMANVVLVAYIYVAWKDDQAEREADAKQKAKKAQ
ncbi:vacuolar ATPase assembly integral membrane protein VMA21 [Aspergillus ibericus CBS 121593]|uniref:Vacuolar ATPase assembly integral membrane protein VMA21 n=1 Tax=Aspergillus ibericus CBS 121593 TaxID=1448316 RepID=A0A395H5P0_9EURO|nr:vacuolar ATPase assembly integral membrane protein VMA21 [Aspergillus ibericus CBS 121593]RAL02923.1 vacuolar ATPase assembly integral membrane protein VMA21 [Aspergillus ibericus CBS 121593]